MTNFALFGLWDPDGDNPQGKLVLMVAARQLDATERLVFVREFVG